MSDKKDNPSFPIRIGDIFQYVGLKDGSVYLVSNVVVNQYGEEGYEIEYLALDKYHKAIYEQSYLRSLINKGSWKHFPVEE